MNISQNQPLYPPVVNKIKVYFISQSMGNGLAVIVIDILAREPTFRLHVILLNSLAKFKTVFKDPRLMA